MKSVKNVTTATKEKMTNMEASTKEKVNKAQASTEEKVHKSIAHTKGEKEIVHQGGEETDQHCRKGSYLFEIEVMDGIFLTETNNKPTNRKFNHSSYLSRGNV